ncbi:uncharacterized protein SEPMUDRAFT_62303 [Sphaerulina musiva SO2202]|uniref:SMP-30/Gluconolactonase/LRE-like region domain-containing protein n=1 Tax=Sphaerulina musiva (strain SO2202) TaxID=692275 RepID=M3D8F9_SPHMS|nr:uncharacterized protein SEPMUDRAFT_62303 [Sphaerulina musiva SO2202]EMF14174.1 hypothetical protein SEPMUDRAFT_62303 [Sphaerulina musiva SO2202]
MSPTPQIFTAPSEPFYKCNPPMVLGESPIYRASDSTLHWVDCLITPPELHILHLDPTTHQPLGPSKRISLSDSVSVLFFRQSHPKSYICAYYQGIAFLDEDTGKLEVVKEIIPAEERGLRRFNDGGVDAKGRLWLAEIDVRAAAAVDAVASDEGKERVLEDLGEPVGRLWRYDLDGTLHLMDRGVICGNGVGWSPDWKSMYFNDSVGKKVFAYNFHLESGTISHKRLLIDKRNSPGGEPDGMVIDTNGNLWIAMYATWRIMAFTPQGEVFAEIILPSYNITCPTWGGPNFETLYITSASHRGTSEPPQEGDLGGHVYSFTPGIARGGAKGEFAG